MKRSTYSLLLKDHGSLGTEVKVVKTGGRSAVRLIATGWKETKGAVSDALEGFRVAAAKHQAYPHSCKGCLHFAPLDHYIGRKFNATRDRWFAFRGRLCKPCSHHSKFDVNVDMERQEGRPIE